MRQLEEQLCRQVVAILLYNRRFHRSSKPALDVFASVFEAVMIALWRRAGRTSELAGQNEATLIAVMEELLRSSLPLYVDREELVEYEREQPELEAQSVMEERGLVTPLMRLLTAGKVDPKLVTVVVNPNTEETSA